jgi:hypothetical protein
MLAFRDGAFVVLSFPNINHISSIVIAWYKSFTGTSPMHGSDRNIMVIFQPSSSYFGSLLFSPSSILLYSIQTTLVFESIHFPKVFNISYSTQSLTLVSVISECFMSFWILLQFLLPSTQILAVVFAVSLWVAVGHLFIIPHYATIQR